MEGKTSRREGFENLSSDLNNVLSGHIKCFPLKRSYRDNKSHEQNAFLDQMKFSKSFGKLQKINFYRPYRAEIVVTLKRTRN